MYFIFFKIQINNINNQMITQNFQINYDYNTANNNNNNDNTNLINNNNSNNNPLNYLNATGSNNNIIFPNLKYNIYFFKNFIFKLKKQ